MFCQECGKEYSQRVNFCCHCGAALTLPPAPQPAKKLARSRTDHKIAGVCGGFADYLEVDVTLVRILWLMLAFVGGWGILGYIIAWIAMPEEPLAKAAPVSTESPKSQPAVNHGMA
jgi:phage shock protein C